MSLIMAGCEVRAINLGAINTITAPFFVVNNAHLKPFLLVSRLHVQVLLKPLLVSYFQNKTSAKVKLHINFNCHNTGNSIV